MNGFPFFFCTFAANMNRPFGPVTKTLSVRISLMVVSVIAVFLLSALFAIFYYSQKVLKEEALEKARQTLDSTILQIDNILLSVEQASGNVYWDLLLHLDQPELMFSYGRHLLASNPYIVGCAMAFEPNYYKDRGEYYMAYVHRSGTSSTHASDSTIIESTTFGNSPYTQQVWYNQPIETHRAIWLNPLDEQIAQDESIITFSLPIYEYGKVIGVMGVDISLSQLSQIVAEAKPSPNSYAILINSKGSYIVHPDKSKLYNEKIISQQESSALREIGNEMITGKTDYRQATIDNTRAFVFYKPFKRSAVPGRTMDDLGWSIAIVYPEEDILGDYHLLLTLVLIISLGGLLLLFILCRVVTHRQILPLRHLAASAQRIAEGDFNTPVCDCHQIDEVGRLQDHFQHMQQALSIHVGELQQLTDTLQEQGRITAEAYEQAKEADRMKTAFLHNMTNQMIVPANAMSKSVTALCDQQRMKTAQQVEHLANDIQQQGETITELLHKLIDVSRESKPTATNH